jgi:hypothetical protein
MDVDAQVVAESSRNGARGRSERPGGRRCGVCGKAGHRPLGLQRPQQQQLRPNLSLNTSKGESEGIKVAHQSQLFRGGFRGAGIAPLNPENVISKLDVQLRTPTPPQEAVEPSTPWVSKTPKTAIEAQSQSEYLEKRIKRHKSSSPESIIEALKSSTKATKAALHRLALVEARLKDLEQRSWSCSS